MLNPRDPTIVANKCAMQSFKDSKTDYEIFSGLAKKLGFLDSFTENKSEMDWIQYIWDKSSEAIKEKNLTLPSFEEFWEKGSMSYLLQKLKILCCLILEKIQINFH